MAGTFLLEYIEKDSVIHRLNGAAKLICFILWTVAIMFTYDTRLLLALTFLGFVLFRISKIKFNEIKIVFYLITIFLMLNLIMIFLFSPLEGTKIYGTRHDIFKIFGNYVITKEQLFYEFNIFIKYFSVIPVALLFIITTNPSEFASSLNRIGVPYKFSYAVSIALRYIPTVQEDFITISKAQQAKGIDISKNVKLITRIKNISYTLMPLIFSSIEKIDIISNAMILRGFGKGKKRTWYQARKMKMPDVIAIFVTAIFVIASIVLIKINNGRFYNPFVN
ncbi:cobalt transporter [Leptotrichia shahii]|uniref:Cobalt transporter n=1 Tax=Leptotrichia shahii TaxID=157691 RepID=A0A510JPC7_9FUSO|nr:energy-coupling factor transporter transmembrane component T [Leptotrichia shahii]BBM41054.1 cobalt transporter [Leptotrichia shahii]